MKKKVWLIGLGISLQNTASWALATTVDGWQLNGFLSAAAAWHTAGYLAGGVEPFYASDINKRPSFDKDTNLGVQITKSLRQDVSITAQFLSEASKGFKVEATWAFLKYEPNNHWQFRVGRVHTNPYMFSEYVDVAYVYPWVRPPQEVYSQIPPDYSRPVGVDARYQWVLWGRDLTLTGFYGAMTSRLHFPASFTSSLEDNLQLRLSDLCSFDAKYGNEIFNIRAGYQSTHITLNPNSGTIMTGLNDFLNNLVNVGAISDDYLNYFSAKQARSSFMGTGYQFNWNNIVSMGEIVKRRAATPIVADAVGWYLMAGYRVKKLLPHFTFARERLLDNKTRRFNGVINGAALAAMGTTLDSIAQALVRTSPSYSGGAGSQTSITFGIRWDVLEGIALKAEYQHVHPDKGTAGLFNVIPQQSANICSIAINAVM